jgi:hypothetical protein
LWNGGGEVVAVHSSVVACQWFCAASRPLSRLQRKFVRKISCPAMRTIAAMLMTRFWPRVFCR